MKTKVNTTFESYTITLDSNNEVRDLLGILDKVRYAPKFVKHIQHQLQEIVGAPMGGMYDGEIKRNSHPSY